MQGITNCVQEPGWAASAPVQTGNPLGTDSPSVHTGVTHTFPLKHAHMHMMSLCFHVKAELLIGVFVTAEEYVPKCLETEIKAGSYGS